MDDTEALELDDRITCATAQVGMEMTGGVMTSRRLGQVAQDWSDDGDAGIVLAQVWAQVAGSTRHLGE